jgi:hypothetical protein
LGRARRLDNFRGYKFRSERDFIAALEAWLAPSPFVPRCVGKALSFAACFEHKFSSQFTDEHWVTTRRCIEEERAAFAEQGNFESADEVQRLLDEPPEQHALWIHVQELWFALKREHLSRDAVDSWMRQQLAERFVPSRAYAT